jgi:hypothetical protein
MKFKSSLVAASALMLIAAPAFAQDATAQTPPAEAPAAEAPASEAPAPAPETPAPQAPAAAVEHEPGANKGGVKGVIEIAAPPEGKGQIVFFRASKMMGMALSFKVRENGTPLTGTLSNGRYFVHVAEPGEHTYDVRSEATDKLTLEVEPGETYYVGFSLSMGIMAGRPNISPSTADAFAAESSKLKLSTK